MRGETLLVGAAPAGEMTPTTMCRTLTGTPMASAVSPLLKSGGGEGQVMAILCWYLNFSGDSDGESGVDALAGGRWGGAGSGWIPPPREGGAWASLVRIRRSAREQQRRPRTEPRARTAN